MSSVRYSDRYQSNDTHLAATDSISENCHRDQKKKNTVNPINTDIRICSIYFERSENIDFLQLPISSNYITYMNKFFLARVPLLSQKWTNSKFRLNETTEHFLDMHYHKPK